MDDEASTEPGSSDPAPEPRGSVLWIAATAIVFVVLSLLPLPGIDGEVLAAMSNDAGLLGLFIEGSPLPVMSTGVLLIVPMHLVLMLAGRFDRAAFRVGAAAICLVVVALQALGTAMWLESLNGMNVMFMDVVSNPGWGFRLLLMLSQVTGAAILLWVLNGVDRSGRASGALVLSVFYALSAAVVGAFAAGRYVAVGQITVFAGLIDLVTPLCVLGVALALVVRPLTWPVTLVGSVSLRSGWDLAGAVTLASVPVVMLGSAMAAMSGGGLGLAALGALFQVGFTGVVLFLVFRRGTERGDRPWGLASFSALSALLGVALLVAGALSSPSGLGRLMAPGPLEGDASFVLVLGAERAFESGDGAAMVERLEALGAEAELESQSGERITLAVTADDPQHVVAELQPRELSLHFALNFATNPFEGDTRLHPVTVMLIGSTPVAQTRAWETSCEVASELLSTPPPGECVWRLERGDVEGDCTLHCVQAEPVLTNPDIAEASVTVDSYSSQPGVQMTLAPSATARFGDATAANVGSALTMNLDGEVISAPIVQSAITEGHVQVTLGGYRPYDELRQEAESLAGSLGSDGISWSRFELLEIR